MNKDIENIINISNNRFGVFLKKYVRIYSPFFYSQKYNLISGHKMLDLFIGNYKLTLIYKI